jgi:hypothetical protein
MIFTCNSPIFFKEAYTGFFRWENVRERDHFEEIRRLRWIFRK